MSDVDPYEEGGEAFLAGVEDTANPYKKETKEHDSWDDGWCDAAHPEAIFDRP